MWATINFNRLIQLLLPTFLRKAKMIAFIEILVKPISILHIDTLYKMQHTCQVIYLEKMLNEHFNVSGYDANNHENTKVIYINDAPIPPIQYVYLDQEIPPKGYLYLGTKYLTAATNHSDFVVHIPARIVFVEAKLKALIDYYKLAGKKYLIQIF